MKKFTSLLKKVTTLAVTFLVVSYSYPQSIGNPTSLYNTQLSLQKAKQLTLMLNAKDGSVISEEFIKNKPTSNSYKENNKSAWIDSVWQKSFDAGGNDRGYSAQKTKDGGYIIVGGSDGIGAGDFDAWLIKTDKNGEKEWEKTFGDTYIDDPASIKTTSDSGYIVCGTSSMYRWSGEGWLFKMDKDGNIIWDNGFHPTESSQAYWDYFTDVTESSDGGFVAVGFGPIDGLGWQGWIMKTDSDGNVLWNHDYGEKYWERLFSVQPTSDGGYIAVGDKHVTYNDTTALDGWLVKFNSLGEIEWQRTFGASLHDIFKSVTITSDGGYAIVGERQISEKIGYESWFVKTDSKGTPLINLTYGEGGFYCINELPTGDFLAAGSVFNTETAYDGFLAKINSNGEILAEDTIIASNMDDMPGSLQVTPSGEVIIGGRTNANSATSDYWLVKMKIDGMPMTEFYETFDTITPPAIPSDWTYNVDALLSNTIAEVRTYNNANAPSQPNAAFIMNGLNGSNGQLDTSAFVALISPLAKVGENGATLTFSATGNQDIVVGTMSDPADKSTFKAIKSISLTSSFTSDTIYLFTPEVSYFAFKHGNTSTVSPIFIDNIEFKQGLTNLNPVTEFYETFDTITPPTIPSNWTYNIDVLLSNTIAEVRTYSNGVAPSQPNAAFIMNGLNGSNGQLDTNAFVALISPLVKINNTGSVLTFSATGNQNIVVGKMTDPTDKSTFEAIDTVTLTSDFVNYSDTILQSGIVYLAFKHFNTSGASPIFIDNIGLEPIGSKYYTVTYSAIGEGSITAKINGMNISSGDEIMEGKNIDFTATPNEGYRVKEWLNNSDTIKQDGVIYTNQTFSIENISESTTIKVEFETIPFPTISVNKESVSTEINTSNSQTSETVTIENSGTAPLLWSAHVQYLTTKNAISTPQGKTSQPSNIKLSIKKGQQEKTPFSSKSNITLNYDGDNYNSIGLSEGGTLLVAARFPSDMIGSYTNYSIESVDVYIAENATAITLKIWDTGTTTAPGTLLHEQNFTGTGWVNVALSTPVEITGSDIWIGYEVTNEAGFSPAGIDAGPANANGDWFSADGGTNWEHLADAGYSYNWNIRANLIETTGYSWLNLDPTSGTIENGASQDLSLLINTSGLEDGKYSANVIITSNDPQTSTVTIPVTIDLITVGVNKNELTSLNIYPNPASSILNIQMNEGINSIRLFNATGSLIKEEQANNSSHIKLNVSGINTGIYTLQITLSNRKTISSKVVIMQ